MPLPDVWLREFCGIPLYRRLPVSDRAELGGVVQILAAEKRWEGAAGLSVSLEMKLTILAQAAILLLHRRTRYFPLLRSIIVYPASYDVVEEVETEDGFVEEIDESRAGEAWSSGAVVLSWDDVLRDLTHPQENVVLHEFAHQLDAEDGALNGAPILPTRALRERWTAAMTVAFERLRHAVDREQETLLDPYGADDPAEFFAVATEMFFLRPLALQAEERDVFDLLRDFFHQDPARW